jgi:hypothetical protein
MLENYYSGPPKFEFDSSVNNRDFNKRIQVLNQISNQQETQ